MTQSLRVCICVLSALGRVQSPVTQIVANLSAPGKIDPYQVENCGPIKIPMTETFEHSHLVLGSPF